MLLPDDHRSVEKRCCKRRDNNERPNNQNVRVSFSSAAFFFDSVLAVGRAAHCRSGWGVVSLVTLFYGNGGTKFPDNVQLNERGWARGCVAGVATAGLCTPGQQDRNPWSSPKEADPSLQWLKGPECDSKPTVSQGVH